MMTAERVPSGSAKMRGQRKGLVDLGMWVFLTTETLFFGVLFFGYFVSRLRFPDAFAAASRHTDFMLGTINTGVLLTSSLTMALAVQAAKLGARRVAVGLMIATAAIGVLFLVIKGVEYRNDFLEGLVPGDHFVFDPAYLHGAELFFWLYFVMTGVHAIHLLIGVGLVTATALRMRLAGGAGPTPIFVEATGLYWHFVDIVWIFLYPCLYLVSRS